MAAEVLAAYHSGWAPQLTGLARLRPSTTEQVNDLQNWHDMPGQYIECTCKTTKYIASKQAEGKAGTKHMQQPNSYQKLSMA